MLCSDGLTSMVDDKAILGLVEGRRENLDKAARALVDAANKGGGEDNITVILFEVGWSGLGGHGDAARRRGAGRGRRADADRGRPGAGRGRRHDDRLARGARGRRRAAAAAPRPPEGALGRRRGRVRRDPRRARRLEPLPLVLRRRPAGRARRDLPGLPVEPGRQREALPRPLREHRARRPALAGRAAKALRPRPAGLRPGARLREALRSRDRPCDRAKPRARQPDRGRGDHRPRLRVGVHRAAGPDLGGVGLVRADLPRAVPGGALRRALHRPLRRPVPAPARRPADGDRADRDLPPRADRRVPPGLLDRRRGRRLRAHAGPPARRLPRARELQVPLRAGVDRAS